MANMDSVEFAASGAGSGTKGTLANRRGIVKKYSIPFHLVIANPSSAAPTLRLGVAPVGFRPAGVRFNCEALSASAGVGLNIQIGDTGDTDRLMADTDCDAAVAFNGNVPVAAYDYEYTAETQIIGTVTAAKTPVADKKIWGEIMGYMLTSS